MKPVVTTKEGLFEVSSPLPLPFVVESDCPQCKDRIEVDLETDPMSLYRNRMNKKDEMWFWCLKCDYEYAIPIRLQVKLKLL